MSKEKQKKRHPDYGLSDQVRGRCPYRLASAEIDCDCRKQQSDWEKEFEKMFCERNEGICMSDKGEEYKCNFLVLGQWVMPENIKSFISTQIQQSYKDGYDAAIKDFKIPNKYGEKSL